MFKKYKIRKKHKFNIYIIFTIVVISLTFMSYGYSLWSDKLVIKGTANIKPDTGLPAMTIEVPEAQFSVLGQGWKEVSKTVSGNILTSVLEITGDAIIVCNNSFQFKSIAGDASDGKYEVTITGGPEADTIFSQNFITVPATANGVVGTTIQVYLVGDATKITAETTVDINISYLVGDERQCFHYYIIFQPKATA